MFCPHCGNQIKEGSAFCSHCGSAINQSTVVEQKNISSLAANSPVKSPEDTVPQMVFLGITLPPEFADAERNINKARKEKIDAAYVENPANEAAVSQILGEGRAYYESQFRMIQTSGGCNINWFSLLFGISHAAYKGVWREWLMAMKYPIIAYIAAKLFASLAWWGDFGIIIVLDAILSIGTGIWLFIWWIRTSLNFNKMYLVHVNHKLETNNLTADDSWNRVGIAFAISAALNLIIELIYQSAVESSIMSTFGV